MLSTYLFGYFGYDYDVLKPSSSEHRFVSCVRCGKHQLLPLEMEKVGCLA